MYGSLSRGRLVLPRRKIPYGKEKSVPCAYRFAAMQKLQYAVKIIVRAVNFTYAGG